MNDREFYEYFSARREHAWLLRAERATFREIAIRLGISTERARQMVRTFGERVERAMQPSLPKRPSRTYWKGDIPT